MGIESHTDPPEPEQDPMDRLIAWFIVRGLGLALAGFVIWLLIFVARGCWRAVTL